MKKTSNRSATIAALCASIFLMSGVGTFASQDQSATTKVRKGETFFDEKVVPALIENGCQTCHAQNYVRPRVFEYKELLPYLGMGSTDSENVLINKLANLRSFSADRYSHPGGKRCDSINREPCATLRQWWHVEFGSSHTDKSGKGQ